MAKHNYTPFIYAIATGHTNLLCEMEGCDEPAAYSLLMRTDDGEVDIAFCVPHFVKLKATVEHPHGEEEASNG